jgi:fucose permease
MRNIERTSRTHQSLFLVVVTYLAFISLGLPDGLIGIAWPFMSSRSNVSIDSLGVLLMSFTGGYLSTSSTSAKILHHMSLGMLLSVSCLVTAASLLTYSFTGGWYFMIIASFFLGSGGGAIDSSINTFAASAFSASTVNWLHAFYGVGATTGPLLVTLMLSVSLQWYHAYLIVAVIQILLAILFMTTHKRWRLTSNQDDRREGTPYRETIKLPIVWLYGLIFFLYTGLEQGFGQWLFTVLTKSRSIHNEQAGLWTSLYWGSLTVGRILFGIVLTRIQVNVVLIGAIAGIAMGVFLFVADINPTITLLGIIIMGTSNAPVFPSLISVTPVRIGERHTAAAIGIQVSMAMIGGALVPGIAGFLSDSFGLEIIPRVFFAAAIILVASYFVATRFGRSQAHEI